MKNQEIFTDAINSVRPNLKSMKPFNSHDDAKEFLIACGKEARCILNENSDSFLMKKMFGEITEAWYRSLKSDCGFNCHKACEAAVTYLYMMKSRNFNI